MDNFDAALLRRALGQKKPQRVIRQLYADKVWVEDLDIINELGGHTGCVNALSWSSSGGLLASGSDDTYLNIWDYNPANLAKPFTLNTSVSTGHTANIFSVKFMPHSNDRTVVTCAGDSEVRVFDLEYSGANHGATGGDTSTSSTRSRRFNDFFGNARWLSEVNTNARVYRSHSDRAKRIVTESSPHLFLTCSEDGEVRQWDLRQPSSAYPAPHGMRRLGRFRTAYNEDTSTQVPPPLISYKKYQLDLNSISCSASQPHYITLGGAHLHCFLHDRRMLGRDISAEQGRPAGFKPTPGTHADDSMREATKCVRRFAPNNKRKMKHNDTGHITACKISDARPNELISSWSGDYIYSFDIVKSPDAKEIEAQQEKATQEIRLRHQSDRKRKRLKKEASSSTLTAGSRRRLRRVADDHEEDGQTALRVRYENGETEDIPIGQTSQDLESGLTDIRDNLLTDAQRQGERIARSLVQLRKTLFDFSSTLAADQIQAMENSSELTPHTPIFTKALGQAATLLPQLDEAIRSWSYPMNPDEDEVEYQNTLRRNRQACWRFVQAAGCLSVTLGGRLQTVSAAEDPRMANFDKIRPASREGRHISRKSRFCYDFLKAILLWINGGAPAVLNGFRKLSGTGGETLRYPLAEQETLETFADLLCEYFLEMVDEEKPIIDLGTSRFERDELRHVFSSQSAAVRAFIRALTGVELRENQGLSGAEADQATHTTKRIMDKGAAARFWGLKVGRSLLLDAAEGVTFSFTQHAFGGPRVRIASDIEDLGHLPHDVSDEDEDRAVDFVQIVRNLAAEAGDDDGNGDDNGSDENEALGHADTHDTPSLTMTVPEVNEILIQDGDGDDDHDDDEDEEEEDDDDDYGDHDNDRSDGEDNDDGDDLEDAAQPIYRTRAAFGRSAQRADVNIDVPYSSHTKIYKGHCNTRTIKDVNYFGLDDEYVVSGSDDGHFFIWDRKTCQVVNILEGDGEVVNVVQGHPYEPLIACSGIDSSVKIFGPGRGSRDRHDAIKGINIANPGEVVHSSLRHGGRSRRSRDAGDEEDESGERNVLPESLDEEPKLARNGLRSRRAMDRCYEIMSQNDAMRRDGVGEAILTEGMLARFAAVLQRAEAQGAVGQAFGGTGGTIVLDDNNCSVM